MKSKFTLHYFRMEEVCRVVLDSDSVETDKIGIGLFANLTLRRGPEAKYGFHIFIHFGGGGEGGGKREEARGRRQEGEGKGRRWK